MEASIISQLITGFGPTGAFVGYLVWQQMRRDAIDRDRIEADLKLAETLAKIQAFIEGIKR